MIVRALCPRCGILGWLAPPADRHQWVRNRIVAEGGNGRVHRCEATALAGVSVYELENAVGDLVELGRTLERMEVLR